MISAFTSKAILPTIKTTGQKILLLFKDNFNKK